MSRRVCATCGKPVRVHRARWQHDERRVGTIAARRLDADHRAVRAPAGSAAPTTTPELPPEPRAARKPQRPIVPLPQPVRWGRQEPFERRPFNAETTRRRGCEVAAGIPLLGEL